MLHLYWLAPNSRIRSARFDFFTTDVAHNAQDWFEAPASDLYAVSAGSSLVSYGRECLDAPCPQWSYPFWQEGDAVRGAGLEPGGQWESLGPRLGASSGGFDSNGATPPSGNSSMAIALSRTDPNNGTRSLSVFYRTEPGALGQIIYDRSTAETPYRGYSLPREGLGPRAAIVALPTGTNDTDPSAEPLGFQVLTADPDADGDRVQLTYYRDGEWTAAEGEVSELADCADRAVMTAIRAGRVYCVVVSGNDDDRTAGIVEFAWEGDPEGDVSSYTNYRRVGTVNTTVK